MIVNTFKGGHPVGFVIAPVILIVMAVIGAGNGVVRMETMEMPLYQFTADLFSVFPDWAVTTVVIGLIGFQAFQWNKIIADYEVLYKKSLLPLLLFTVFANAVPDFFSFNPALVVTSIALVICEKLFSLYKNPNPLRIIFDTAFWSGVACLFWFPAVTLFLFVLVSWIILKNVTGRDLLVGLIGFVLPFFLAAVMLFWTDSQDPINRVIPILDSTSMFYPFNAINQNSKWSLAVFGIFLLLSVWRINRNFYKNATRVRLFQQAVFLLFIFIPLSVFLSPGSLLISFYPLVIPISLMLSYYFLLGKSIWWGELLFTALITSVLLLSFGIIH